MIPRQVAVVGGGMSGVATAWYLMQAGHRPTIFEAGPSLGGRAGSAQLGDRVVDIGGKNIGRRYTLFREFIAAHGSPPLQYFGINSSTVVDGQLRTVDSQRKFASLFHIVRMIGFKDTLRLAYLARKIKRSPSEGLLGGAYFSKLAEKHDHEPISRWFDASTLQRLLRPIIIRMNGAEPDEYAYGNFGSNLKMVTDRYDQLTLGMSDLLKRFQAHVDTAFGSRVVGLRMDLNSPAGRPVALEIESSGQPRVQRFDAVALTLPAPLSAPLISDRTLSEALLRVAYNPVTLAVVEYARPIFDTRVRAIVFDEKSALSNAGCYGLEDLHVVRYTLSGRKAREIGDDTDPLRVIDQAEKELGRYVPVSAKDRVDFVYRRFSRGLCSYTPYHHRLLGEIKAFQERNPLVGLSGDYVFGASIESCFRAGQVCAESLIENLSRHSPTPRGEKPTPEKPSTQKRDCAQPSLV